MLYLQSDREPELSTVYAESNDLKQLKQEAAELFEETKREVSIWDRSDVAFQEEIFTMKPIVKEEEEDVPSVRYRGRRNR